MTIIRFFRHNGKGQGKADSSTCYIHGQRVALSMEQREMYRVLTAMLNDAKRRNDRYEVEELLGERRRIVGKLRNPAPVALSDNRTAVEYAIAHSPHQYKYSSGVIAYAKEDNDRLNANPAIAQEFRELFEDLVFAGLPREDRLIEWVQHTHEGNLENHFVIPRINLQTGKYFNPHPPGAEKDFNAVRDYLNAKYQLASPDDPKRQRKIDQRPPRGPYPDLKIYLSNVIADMAADGELTSRQQVIDWLNQKDTRQLYGIVSVEAKRDYLRILTQGRPKAIRLRGQLCGQPIANVEPTPAPQPDLSQLANRVNEVIAKRCKFNRKRYNITEALEPQRPATIQPTLAAQGAHPLSKMGDAKLEPIDQQTPAKAQPEPAQQVAVHKQNTLAEHASGRIQQEQQNIQKQQRGSGYESPTTPRINTTEQRAQRVTDPFSGSRQDPDTAAKSIGRAGEEIPAGRGGNRATGLISEIQNSIDIAIEQTNRSIGRAGHAVADASQAIDRATSGGHTVASRTRTLTDRLDQLIGKLKDNIHTMTGWLTDLYHKANLASRRPNTSEPAPAPIEQRDRVHTPAPSFRAKDRSSRDDELSM